MAEILANWINNELELSKHVDNFEKDFSNGYLLGEILKRYNQQSDFEEFSKKANRDSKINNFALLEPTLKSLNVKFNAQLIDDIMKEKRGAAMRILIQLKMALEKVYSPMDTNVFTKGGRTSDSKPAKKLKPGKEKYDSMSSTLFKRRLQEMNEAQKEINLRTHQNKFEEIRRRQEEKAQKEEEEERRRKIQMQADNRIGQIDKIQRNVGFMEEWLKKGIEDWRNNQTIRKEREKKQLEFEFKQTKKIETMTVKHINKAKHEVTEGIDAFEQNLKKQGIDPDVPGSSASSPSKTRMTGQSSANRATRMMATSLTASMSGGVVDPKIRERGRTMTEGKRKERERRRGKLIKFLNNDILREMENHTREEQYVDRLKRLSKQEEELSYEIWRTQQCKNVIVQNRKLREAQYYKRKELDTNNAYAREEEMLRTLDEQRNIDEESQVERENDLRINDKQAKRQHRTEVCDMMMNEIFEIANQAYILQQKSDCEDIDSRFWREWMELFKEQNSIKETYVEGKPDPDEDDDQVVGQPIIDADEETNDTSQKILDDSELTDYLKNEGQWKPDLVTAEENKVNIAEILGAGEPVAAKGGKGAPAESKIDDKEMEVPEVLPKNNILGDVVEQIIYLNFEGEKDIVKPEVPRHMPLKVAVTGQAFSGKKTQAQLLSEKYNLIQYHPYELINEAIERAEEEIEEVPEEIQPEKVEAEGEGDQKAPEGEGEANKDQDKPEGDQEDGEPKAEGEGQQQPTEDQKPENDEVKAGDDTVENVEQPPPEQTEEHHETHKEVKIPNEDKPIDIIQEGSHEEVLDIEAEFERQGETHTGDIGPQKEKYEKLRRNKFREIGKEIKEQLLKGEEVEETLIVDLLISKIKSDFSYKTQEEIQTEIKKVIEREEEIKEQLKKADELKGKTFKNMEPIDEYALKQELEDLSKYSQYGWVLVDFPSSIAQAHKLEAELSGYLPSIDREIVERNEKLTSACRIIEPSDKPNIKDTLIESGLDSVLVIETSREECRRRALGRRVDIDNDTEYHIDDNPPPTTNPPMCERLMPVIEPERAEEVIPDKHLAYDKQKKKLLQWFSKFGYEEEDNEESKFPLLHTINGDSANHEQILNDNNVLDQILTRKQNQWAELREKYRNEIIAEKERIRLEEEARIKAEEEQKRKEEEEAKRLAELAEKGEDGEEQEQPPEPAKDEKEEPKPDEPQEDEKVEEPAEPQPPSKENIDDDFAPVLMKIWENIEEKYINRMKRSFNVYRNQKDRIVTGFSKTQKYFVQYLNRPDTKQALLDQFVIDFNKFSDEYPDLREDEQTKEELHQRTDTLSDQLWEISENRKEEAVNERQKIIDNGWVEFELDQITAMAQNLMQAEVDKFRSCAHLLQDYYYAIEDRLVPDPPERLNYELIATNEEGEPEEQPPVFEKDPENPEAVETYPRLDKLFGKALKAQVLPELESTPPGGAAAAGDKKGAVKKDPKKGAAEEETEEKYFYEEELNQAIDTEKAVLRYRVTMIRNWALNLMKDIRSKSETCYNKLNTWIQVAFKAETDAILEKEKVIKRSIEEEEKLQHELRIKGMDFHLDEKFLNFEDPPPEIFHAREEPIATRFTIKQLESLVNEFIISSVNGHIKNDYFVDLMVAKTKNSSNFSDENGIPEVWRDYNRSDYELVTKAYDVKLTGYISLKKVAITMCLMSTTMPTDSELKEYREALEVRKEETDQNVEPQISKTNFVEAKAWFDENEKNHDRPNSHSYPRVKNLKSIIFDTVKEENNLLNIPEFLSLLALKVPGKQLTTYGDVLVLARE